MSTAYRPVLIYTDVFQSSDCPARDIRRLEKFNLITVAKMLVVLRIAIQESKTKNIVHPGILALKRTHPAYLLRESELSLYIFSDSRVILELLSDVFNSELWNTDSGNFDDTELQRALFETILIYNDHNYGYLGIGERPDTFQLIWQICFMQELNAENPTSYSRTGVSKQFYFNSFLQKFLGDEYPEFERQVKIKTGLQSINAYIRLFLDLQLFLQDAVNKNTLLLQIPDSSHYYKLLHDLELVFQPGESRCSILELSMKPFVEIEKGAVTLNSVADFGLITRKGWDYFIFKKNLLPKSSKLSSKYESMQALFGKKYYEEYLMGKLLNYLSQENVKVYNELSGGGADWTVIVNDQDVFLFEIKSTSLNVKITVERDINGFTSFIDENFVKGKKGAPQLNRNISHLADNYQLLYNINKKLSDINVYPIIVYTEPFLMKSGINSYVLQFGPPLPENIKNKFKVVNPITMIHYDFFVDNIKLLKSDVFLLKNLIDEFHAKILAGKIQYQRYNSTSNFLQYITCFDYSVVGKNGVYRLSNIDIINETRKILNI